MDSSYWWWQHCYQLHGRCEFQFLTLILLQPQSTVSAWKLKFIKFVILVLLHCWLICKGSEAVRIVVYLIVALYIQFWRRCHTAIHYHCLFKYSCEGYSPIHGLSNSTFSHTSCGYTPGTNITCSLQAVADGNRSSDAIKRSGYLPCSGLSNS
jgi:hypothetical protein